MRTERTSMFKLTKIQKNSIFLDKAPKETLVKFLLLTDSGTSRLANSQQIFYRLSDKSVGH